ncbi:hypothetical protein [Leadbettera azotonutricia]|uniref:Putative lipoprotein n=1 Tax=Leadbettera azotonutricia (strain ATCC BAA-888 / DSM 13862 / ZAS-9) TaxID=545695 RepID=F5YCT4_LEAAZ|nr:hypothetical protein [Leadbettera azotonutricia]AEF81689.1 putative lipoprotein [Leadbettera azotonutricia ZAS-9]
MKKLSGFLIFNLILLISGCSTLMNKAGEALDGTAFADKTLAIYATKGKRKERKVEARQVRLKNGEEMLAITDSNFPGLEFRGYIPDSSGNFELGSAKILSSHVHGWNEFTLDILGSASFSVNGDRAILNTPQPIEGVQISAGRIRLKSNRITGTEALANLRNRRERILALIDWMKKQPGIPEFKNQKDFDKYWGAVLFPKQASNSKFGESLEEYYDSGAMLRDWEEASPWIYIEYCWDDIIAGLNNTVLTKTK